MTEALRLLRLVGADDGVPLPPRRRRPAGSLALRAYAAARHHQAAVWDNGRVFRAGLFVFQPDTGGVWGWPVPHALAGLLGDGERAIIAAAAASRLAGLLEERDEHSPPPGVSGGGP
jgi:hypothetical protein